jgi:thiol-disulfide isomerase/thioredoxin
LSGKHVDLAKESGWIFINYWAVWCAPCIAEMPELATFASLHSKDVRVYGVNFDKPDREELRANAEALNVEIELLLEDPQIEFNYARPEVLPTTIILYQGAAIETLVGPQTIESLEERLQWWMNNR